MSATRRRPKLCAACQDRLSRFSYRRRVKADRDHVLCFQCHRAEWNRARARALAGPERSRRVQRELPFDTDGLSADQIAHRERMLAHLIERRRASVR